MTSDRQPIKLDLEVDDINLVLEALGAMPFARVYDLVGRIQQQAQRQLSNGSNGADEEELQT